MVGSWGWSGIREMVLIVKIFTSRISGGGCSECLEVFKSRVDAFLETWFIKHALLGSYRSVEVRCLQVPVILADYVEIPPKYVTLMQSLFLRTPFPACAHICWDVARIVRSPTLYRAGSHGVSNTYRWSESSFTPCTAALDPDAILRDKHSTVSDQNIIDWIPNIVYCGIRDIHRTVWSSSTPIISGIWLPCEILMESWRRSSGICFILFIIPSVLEEMEIFPSWVESRKKRGTEGGNPGTFHHHSQFFNSFVPHLDCQLQTSNKPMALALPHQLVH